MQLKDITPYASKNVQIPSILGNKTNIFFHKYIFGWTYILYTIKSEAEIYCKVQCVCAPDKNNRFLSKLFFFKTFTRQMVIADHQKVGDNVIMTSYQYYT